MASYPTKKEKWGNKKSLQNIKFNSKSKDSKEKVNIPTINKRLEKIHFIEKDVDDLAKSLVIFEEASHEP